MSPCASCCLSRVKNESVDCDTPSPTSPADNASRILSTWRTIALGSGLLESSPLGPTERAIDQNRSARLPGARFIDALRIPYAHRKNAASSALLQYAHLRPYFPLGPGGS